MGIKTFHCNWYCKKKSILFNYIEILEVHYVLQRVIFIKTAHMGDTIRTNFF